MAAERDRFDAGTMARLLEAGASGSYAWRKRNPDPDPWLRLRKAVGAVWETSRKTCGARQILKSLPEDLDRNDPI